MTLRKVTAFPKEILREITKELTFTSNVNCACVNRQSISLKAVTVKKRLILSKRKSLKYIIFYHSKIAPYIEADVGKFKSIVSFDCRGIEPIEFSPKSGWIAKAVENGQTFEDIDLSEDDWVDYDEKNKESVGITEFKSQFVKLKK